MLTRTPLLPTQIVSIIKEGGGGACYKLQQIFNMDETGLQWKKMPDCTYVTREKSAPGFKAFKSNFTLLLGAYLMGDYKLKPILVYHAKNPYALKGYDKTSLPVHRFANSTGWMMGHIFQAYSKMHKLKEYIAHLRASPSIS